MVLQVILYVYIVLSGNRRPRENTSHFWLVKLICCCWTFSKFQDVIKHVDFKRPKKDLYGSFGALSYLDVIRKWPSQGGVLRRNVNLGRNEKLGSLEISIVRKFASPMSFGSLTRTRNGELPFRPCSTFPLPDIAKITNRTKKENKKRVYFQSELYKGMYIQWKRGTNYIVKTHMLHYRVPDTRTKSHYGTLESHISQVI